jgi:hypothetical protein
MVRTNLHLHRDILKRLKFAAKEVDRRMQKKGQKTKTSAADLIRFGIAQILDDEPYWIHISGKELSRTLQEIKQAKENARSRITK